MSKHFRFVHGPPLGTLHFCVRVYDIQNATEMIFDAMLNLQDSSTLDATCHGSKTRIVDGWQSQQRGGWPCAIDVRAVPSVQARPRWSFQTEPDTSDNFINANTSLKVGIPVGVRPHEFNSHEEEHAA